VVTGGKAMDRKGYFYEATIMTNTTPDMRLIREEIFGPVGSVIPFDDEEEALAAANDTEYGLAAAVFGRDLTRAFDVARRIESGICHINGATVHDEAHAPLGGMKASGYGRFGGAAAVHEFTELRWITVGPGKRSYPM